MTSDMKVAWREAIGQAASADALTFTAWDAGLAVLDLATSPTSTVALTSYRRINTKLGKDAGDKAVFIALAELQQLGWLKRVTGSTLGWELTMPVTADASTG